MRGSLDEIVRLQTSEMLRREGGDVLGEEKASRNVEVPLHLFWIDLQSFGYLAYRGGDPAGKGEGVGEGLPFGVPGSGGPLMLLEQRRLQRVREIQNPPGARDGDHGEDRVPLVGERRGASASCGLGYLPDLRLRHRDDVRRQPA